MQLIFEILIEEAIEYDSLKSRRLSILSVNFILFKGNFETRWKKYLFNGFVGRNEIFALIRKQQIFFNGERKVGES